MWNKKNCKVFWFEGESCFRKYEKNVQTDHALRILEIVKLENREERDNLHI